MKTRFLTFLLLAIAAPAALAWPFRNVTMANATGFEDDLQPRILQTDPDRTPEYFCGGTSLFSRTGEPRWQGIGLPLPDNDPHPANGPVTWHQGRGDTGDIDNDGDTDIVYSSLLFHNGGSNLDNVRILACRNNGDGTWTRVWQLKDTSAAVLRAPEVKLADFDRDGDLDLVETSNGLRVMWNDGTGNFSTATAILYAAYPAVPGLTDTPEIEVADFDGNGWPDLVQIGNVRLSANDQRYALTGRVTLFSNEGGTFTASTLMTNPAQVEFELSATADLDGDGRLDLLVSREHPNPISSADGSQIHWFRNTGSGFAAPVLVHSNAGGHPIVFAPGDVDEDGQVDLVISEGAQLVKYLKGTGNGGFNGTVFVLSGTDTSKPNPLCVADMDGDGDNDIVCRSGATLLENAAIHSQSGAGVTAFSGINPTGTVDLTTGDVNNDGKNDLIAADGGGKRLRWYPGNGTGLEVPSFVSTGNLVPESVAAGDFNGDGWTDLAWTTTNTLHRALSVNGSGFSWNIGSAAIMTGITRILPEDMDRDGDTDLLSISPAIGLIRWHRNDATAANWLPQNVDTGLAGLTTFTTGPLVPGGRPEVVALSGNIAGRYRYSTAGVWNETVINHNNGTPHRAVVMADLHDDFPGPETISALSTNFIYYTNPMLQSGFSFGSSEYPVNQLAAVDWNRDGRTDLLAATTNSVSLFTHKLQGTQPRGTRTHLLEGVSIQDIVVMDLDGDSFPDAVAVDTTGQLHLIYNRSAAVDVQIAGQGIRRYQPGTPAYTAINVEGTNLGAHSSEAQCTPASMILRFRRSNLTGGVDIPGAVLTQEEVSALVENLAVASSDTYATVVPSGVTNGFYTFFIPEDARSSLRASVGETTSFELQIRFKSTAANSGITRFLVEYSPASPWVARASFPVPGTLSGPTALRLTGTPDPQRTVFNLAPPTPLETWRQSNFGTYAPNGSSANDADPDGDGNSNLVEYIMGQNPKAAGGIGSSSPIGLTVQGMGLPVVADLRLLTTYDSNVRLTLQQSTGLTDWTTLSQRTGTGAWTGPPPTSSTLSGGRTRWNFNTAVPAFAPKFFLRLVVEELP